MSGTRFTTDRREALALGVGAALLPLAGEAIAASSSSRTAADAALRMQRDQPFNNGWRFFRGESQGADRPGFDDTDWRSIDLPHDWSIEDVPGGTTGPFTKNSVGKTATGYTEGGEGWYRRHFRVDGLPIDARVEVLFDGIYLDSDLWLNGQKLGSNLAGYKPFALDLTDHLNRGGDNVLAVRVRNLGRNSRWYSGSGIYREVRIDAIPAGARLARWGVAAWTRSIVNGAAAIEVTTAIEQPEGTLQLVTRMRDAAGRIVAEASSPASGEVKQTLSVRAPRLWSVDSPALYSLETELQRDAAVVDRMVQPIGIRIVTFDAQRGMAINGERVILRGGCIHHDNGLLGACAYTDADERRIRLLKARGYNAIRSSHNISSRSFRDACDRLGMLLIDEAFDTWDKQKLPDDFSVHFADHWQDVVEGMVLAARNSPSVIMWSLGNEIPQRATDQGVEWEWKLANAVKRLDQTRPVTAGLNGVLGAPMVASDATARPGFAGKKDNASTIFLDVLGYNYRLEDIEPERTEHPERVIYGSETVAVEAWDYARLVERMPGFLGEFLWTAMDYLGEAGVGASTNISVGGVAYNLPTWPWVGAWCGDVDLIGNQKAPSRYRDVVWGLSPFEMAVQRPIPEGKAESIAKWGWSDELQSWSWSGHEGEPLAVRFYTPGDRVELRLNGTKVGEVALAPADKMRAEIKTAYAPGVIEAIAYKGGRVIGRKRFETVGAPAQLRLKPESMTGASDRQGLSFIQVEVLDAQGRLIPDEQRKITLAIDGPADLAGFGSANPLAVGSFQRPQAESFHGQALAILRAKGAKGTVRISAQAEGLRGASTHIKLV